MNLPLSFLALLLIFCSPCVFGDKIIYQRSSGVSLDDLQQSVDEGHEPWLLEPLLVVASFLEEMKLIGSDEDILAETEEVPNRVVRVRVRVSENKTAEIRIELNHVPKKFGIYYVEKATSID